MEPIHPQGGHRCLACPCRRAETSAQHFVWQASVSNRCGARCRRPPLAARRRLKTRRLAHETGCRRLGVRPPRRLPPAGDQCAALCVAGVGFQPMRRAMPAALPLACSPPVENPASGTRNRLAAGWVSPPLAPLAGRRPVRSTLCSRRRFPTDAAHDAGAPSLACSPPVENPASGTRNRLAPVGCSALPPLSPAGDQCAALCVAGVGFQPMRRAMPAALRSPFAAG